MTNGTPEMEGSNRNTSDQFEPLRSEDSGEMASIKYVILLNNSYTGWNKLSPIYLM